MSASCREFRQAVEELTGITDSVLLDTLERLHYDCKQREDESAGSSLPQEAEETERFKRLCHEMQAKIIELQSKLDELRSEKMSQVKKLVHIKRIRSPVTKGKDPLCVYDQRGMSVKFVHAVDAQYGLRYCDVTSEPGCTPSVIQGLNHVPLKSLEDSLMPLKGLTRSIDRMAWMVKQRCKKPVENLSWDESASVMLFTMEVHPRHDSLYVILNEKLEQNDRTELEPWFLYLRLFMFSLSKLPAIDERVVYRSALMDLSKQYPVGKTFIWNDFAFCTRSLEMVEALLKDASTKTIFKIECWNAKDIRSLSCFQAQDEVLLLPGQSYEVLACGRTPSGVPLIHVKEIQRDSSSLPLSLSEQNEGTTETVLHDDEKPTLEQLISNQRHLQMKALDSLGLTDRDMPIVAEKVIIQQACVQLDLGYNRITGQGISYIASALNRTRQIRRLYLGGNRLCDDGVARLLPEVKDSSLFVLGLSDNGITDAAAQDLSQLLGTNRRLTVLGLEDNDLGNESLHQMALALRLNHRLERLLLRNNKKITDECSEDVKYIIQRTTLKRLDLRNCSLSDMGIEQLRHLAESRANFKLLI